MGVDILRRPRLRRLWRNVLISLAVVVVALIVIIPTVYFEYYNTQIPSADELEKQASQYAVIKHAFADPSLIRINGTFYAFATRSIVNRTLNVQLASAPVGNPSAWALHDGYDALPHVPSWARQTGDAAVWAPQPVQRADGTFVLYFAAPMYNRTKKHCLGVATSRSVLGPYTPQNTTDPLLCHLNEGGIIDPSFLMDPNAPANVSDLLIYKNDGNGIGSGGACGNSIFPNSPTTCQYEHLQSSLLGFRDPYVSQTAIYTNTTLNASGLDPSITAPSNATIFLRNSYIDGANIESPQVWYREATLSNGTIQKAYHLLYNSGCFTQLSYRINYLRCVVDGHNVKQFTDCPWQALKSSFDAANTSPLLETGVFKFIDSKKKKQQAHLYAPGGPGVAESTDGRTYMVFHADLNPTWFGASLQGHSGPHKYYRRARSVARRIVGRHERLDKRTNAGGDPSTAKGRTRGMFIAELDYSTDNGEVYIKEILPPS